MIPFAEVRGQMPMLKAAGLNIEWQEFQKVHTIAEDELAVVRDFVRAGYPVSGEITGALFFSGEAVPVGGTSSAASVGFHASACYQGQAKACTPTPKPSLRGRRRESRFVPDAARRRHSSPCPFDDLAHLRKPPGRAGDAVFAACAAF